MMIDEDGASCAGGVYPVEAEATGSARTVSSSSSVSYTSLALLHPEHPPRLDEAAPKVHHLHVASTEDDFKRSLRFMQGGNTAESSTGSSILTASAKRVALGDGDQRMYRHRASVAGSRKGNGKNTTPTTHARRSQSGNPFTEEGVEEAGSITAWGGGSSSSSPTNKARRERPAGGTTIMDPLMVEVMESIGDSPIASAAASPSGAYASSTASPLGRSRVATAAPNAPKGKRLYNDTREEDEEEEEEKDAQMVPQGGARKTHTTRHTQRESIVSEDASSPVWHRSPRTDLSLNPSEEKIPLLHRSPQSLSLNASLQLAPTAAGMEADTHQRSTAHRESVMSDDAQSPVWHESPRADASLSLGQEKTPLMHRSPRELSLNNSQSSYRGGRSGVHMKTGPSHSGTGANSSAPHSDGSPRIASSSASKGATRASELSPARLQANTRQSSRLSADENDAEEDDNSPIWHKSPRQESLETSQVPPHEAAHHHQHCDHCSPHQLDTESNALTHVSYDSGATETSTEDDSAEEEAGSPVWTQHRPNRDDPFLNASMQSSQKAPIMHTSPATSMRASPVQATLHTHSDRRADEISTTAAAPQPQIPVPAKRKSAPVKSPSLQSDRMASSSSHASSASPSKPTPKNRKTSRRKSSSSTAASAVDAAVPAPPSRKPAVPRFPHRKQSDAPTAAHAPQRRDSEDAKLSFFVRQIEAHSAASSPPGLPAVLPTYPREEMPYDPAEPVVRPNGTVNGHAGPQDVVGESLLDQILRRNGASSATNPAGATSSLTGFASAIPAQSMKRFSSSCTAALSSDYNRPYELTSRDSLPHIPQARSLPRAHTTLTSSSWKVTSARTRRQAEAVVQVEKMDVLVPVKPSHAGHGTSRGPSRRTSASREAEASSRRVQSATPLPPVPPTTTAQPHSRRGESVPATKAPSHTLKRTELPPVVVAAGNTRAVPVSSRGGTHEALGHQDHADATRGAAGGVRRGHRAVAPTSSRYADSPYLQTAATKVPAGQRGAAAATRQRASPNGKKAGKRSPNGAAPSKAKAQKKKTGRMVYDDILNEDDRYRHVLARHGFWGEAVV